MISQTKKGFTLIELLVVIAIIGLLSAVVLASMSGARSKGRDTKRISDVKQLQLALQLYYDQNSSYPSTAGNVNATGILSGLVTSGFISVLPVDPTSGRDYYYQPATFSAGTYTACSASCSTYVLVAQLENDASSLNGYKLATPASMTVNGGSYDCSQSTSPNFIYCVTP